MPTLLLLGGSDLNLRLPWMQGIQRAGWQVQVLSPAPERDFRQHGMAVRTVSGMAAMPSALAAWLHDHTPDLIHSFDTLPGLIAASLLCHRRAAPPLIRTINGMGRLFASDHRSMATPLLRSGYHIAQHYARPASRAMIFQNQEDQRYFRRYRIDARRHNVLIRGAGIDTQHFSPHGWPAQRRMQACQHWQLSPHQPIISCLSRLRRQKGLDIMMTLARHHPDAQFVLAGPEQSGPDAISVAQLRQAGIHYVGNLPDVRPLLAISHWCMLPTRYREGLPRALLEAAAMACPLLASRQAGCRDVVQPGQTGLLVHPNHSHNWRQVLQHALSLPDATRRAMGQHARQHVQQHFAMPDNLRAHLELYHRLI